MSEGLAQLMVSVVIPCRNEEDYIERCLHSVVNAKYPKELLEVLVCDGRSTDNTAQMIQDMAKDNTNIHYLDNAEQTTPYGLNLGITKAKGDVIIILGAHAEIDPQLISVDVQNLNEHPDAACVGGVLMNVDTGNEAISLAMTSPFGVGARFRTGGKKGFIDTVAFGAYRKEVFDRVGLFNTTLTRNQDDEFNYRLQKAGLKILFDPEAKVLYHVRSNMDRLRSQYAQYGYWKVYVNKLHGSITSFRQLLPMAIVGFYSLGFLLFLAKWVGLPIHRSVPIAWFVIGLFYPALAIGYSAQAIKAAKGGASILAIAWAMMVIHFSYGLGYWKGILDFVLLNRKPGNKHVEATSR